jgi:2-polyprenyl-3-methyl-5-hydroxy-6-metoxy-1,4-benzoquinol methylase
LSGSPAARNQIAGVAQVEEMKDQGRETALVERQERERAYHADYARQHRNKTDQPVLLDVIESQERRPWNGYWATYDLLMAQNLAGKRVMVPGCGFGEDAILLARLGATVHASDLSTDLLDIARLRAIRMGVPDIQFDTMPAESLDYADDFFDVVFFNDILHHVSIPTAISEAQRVCRPGASMIVNEPYTHSAIQLVRNSWAVSSLLYPRLVRLIYGTGDPYITEDERKLDQHELTLVESILQPGIQRTFFALFSGRIAPTSQYGPQKIDRAILRRLAFVGQLLAGRIVLMGNVRK